MRTQKISNWKTTFYSITKIVLIFGVIIIFWIFSRFTVDDAFITWRYGKNLVLHGIWNYNPSSYDMTQAYTNPIYAFLSIIPAYFRIDTVLFFKIVSLVTICSFALYYTKKTKWGTIILLVSFVLPGTMIHAFSGIETFLFITLLTALLISIYEESLHGTIIVSGLLLYTRPESLPLLLVIPLVYCNWRSIEYKNIFSIVNYKPRILLSFIKNFITAKSIKILFILLMILLPNLIISYLNFHNILPNTFFVKNSSVFTLKKIEMYGLLLLPLVMACRYVPIRKNMPIILFFLCMVIQYSKTNFAMDYNLRSLYHIFFPIVLFVFYVMGKDNQSCLVTITITVVKASKNISFEYKNLCKSVVFIILLFFFLRGNFFGISDHAHMANYYYRALSAHAAAGKVINNIKEKYSIHSIACGDAGMLAFHADIDSLDLLELGSAALTHNGINAAYPLYKPDVLFLHGSEEESRGGIFDNVKNISQYENIGRITGKKNYYLWAYSNKNMPELSEIYKKSYNSNYKRDRQVLREHIFLPPWSQWHE
jgi:hypothetical protein